MSHNLIEKAYCRFLSDPSRVNFKMVYSNFVRVVEGLISLVVQKLQNSKIIKIAWKIMIKGLEKLRRGYSSKKLQKSKINSFL